MAKTSKANHLVTAIAAPNGKYYIAFWIEDSWKPMFREYDTFEAADKIARAKGNEAHGENEYISMR